MQHFLAYLTVAIRTFSCDPFDLYVKRALLIQLSCISVNPVPLLSSGNFSSTRSYSTVPDLEVQYTELDDSVLNTT